MFMSGVTLFLIGVSSIVFLWFPIGGAPQSGHLIHVDEKKRKVQMGMGRVDLNVVINLSILTTLQKPRQVLNPTSWLKHGICIFSDDLPVLLFCEGRRAEIALGTIAYGYCECGGDLQSSQIKVSTSCFNWRWKINTSRHNLENPHVKMSTQYHVRNYDHWRLLLF